MENTPEPHRYFNAQSKSNTVYRLCGVFCLAVLVALPLVDIEITVRSPAYIRPAAQISVIRSIQSGRVSQTFLYENRNVKQGDPLLILESENLSEQEAFVHEKILSRKASVQDLRTAISVIQGFNTHEETGIYTIPSFKSDVCRQSFRSYHQRMIESWANLRKARQNYDRNLILFNQQVIPASEFENFEYELHASENALKQSNEDQLAQWNNELKSLLEDQHELESQFARTTQEKKTLTVLAPVNGSVQNLAGIYPGTFVQAHQELGEISPDTSLVVFAYVQPSDIGLIRHGMPVRIQVNAFNYNQWGMAAGQVVEIPQDIKIVDNQPVFEVRCSLEKTYLQLKNGYKGFLKKGMSLQARFIVTRRSLWDLLYDKVDNWVNPNL